MAAASLSVRISAQIAEFQKSFAEIGKTVNKFGAEFESVATRAAAVGSFIGNIAADIAQSVARGLGGAISDAIKFSSEFSNAFIGLSSVARAFGTNTDEATDAAKRLSADGLIPIKDSATGLKNLLATGFSLPQATKLMEAFKDSAAFGRQGALSFGDAVRSATEGVKNGNSILVDNAGITKNLSNILKDAGFSAQDLSKASSDTSVRMALFNGILKEAAAFSGDAAKATQTYSGQVARLDTQYNTLLATLGDAVTQNKTVATAIGFVSDEILGLTRYLGNNRKGFDLVSDGVILMVKALAEAINAIDLIQTAFAFLQTVSNRTFKAFADVGIAVFQFQEKAASAMRFLDPINFERHSAAVKEAKDAYTFLQGAVKGFSDSSKDSLARSNDWGNSLQVLRGRLDTLAKKLEETRGQTVEFGETLTAPLKSGNSGSGGVSADIEKLRKALSDLTPSQREAIRAGHDLGLSVKEISDEMKVSQNVITAYIKHVAAIEKALEEGEKQFKKSTEAAHDLTVMLGTLMKNRLGDIKLGGLKQTTDEAIKSIRQTLGAVEPEAVRLQQRLVSLQKDSLGKRLELINLEYAEQVAGLDKQGQFYQKHLQVLASERVRALQEATKDWNKHTQDIGNALSRLGQATGGIFGGFLSSTGTVLSAFDGMSDMAEKFRKLSKASFGQVATYALNLGTSLVGITQTAIGIIEGLYDSLTGKEAQAALNARGGLHQLQTDAILAGTAFNNNIRTATAFRAEMERLDRVIGENSDRMERYNLTWQDFRLQIRQVNIDQFTRDLILDFRALSLQIGDTGQTIKKMGPALNDLIIQSVKAGTKIPGALEPILQKLIEMGELTDEAARAMLGLAEDTMPSLADITEAAARYGLELDQLGTKVRQLRITDSANQIVKDFNLLKLAGADVGVLMVAMKDKVQGLVTQALQLGLSLPESMRPLIQAMVDAGLLTDEFGVKLTDTGRIEFARPLTESIDDLTAALRDLIDHFSKVATAAEEGFGRARGAAEALGRAIPRNSVPGNPSGEPTSATPRGAAAQTMATPSGSVTIIELDGDVIARSTARRLPGVVQTQVG